MKNTVLTYLNKTQVFILFGRYLFALAIIGLGVEHFIFEKFVTGRAPLWPNNIPGGTAWAYVSGVLLIRLGLGLLFGNNNRTNAFLISLLIFIGAFVWHLPEIIKSSPFTAPTWIAAGKALTFFTGALALATIFDPYQITTSASKLFNRDDILMLSGRVGLGIFMIICGVQHYIYTPFVASLIPKWFPGNPVHWTYITGMTLVAGGLGLFIPMTTRISALLSGLMVFSWFFIIHLPKTFDGESSAIAVFEALAVSAIAFVIYGNSRKPSLVS